MDHFKILSFLKTFLACCNVRDPSPMMGETGSYLNLSLKGYKKWNYKKEILFKTKKKKGALINPYFWYLLCQGPLRTLTRPNVLELTRPRNVGVCFQLRFFMVAQYWLMSGSGKLMGQCPGETTVQTSWHSRWITWKHLILLTTLCDDISHMLSTKAAYLGFYWRSDTWASCTCMIALSCSDSDSWVRLGTRPSSFIPHLAETI